MATHWQPSDPTAQHLGSRIHGQDVRDYFNPDKPLAVVCKGATIVQIRFTTIHKLAIACGEIYWEANYPADLPICYVELSGPFPHLGPPRAPTPSSMPAPDTTLPAVEASHA